MSPKRLKVTYSATKDQYNSIRSRTHYIGNRNSTGIYGLWAWDFRSQTLADYAR